MKYLSLLVASFTTSILALTCGRAAAVTTITVNFFDDENGVTVQAQQDGVDIPGVGPCPPGEESCAVTFQVTAASLGAPVSQSVALIEPGTTSQISDVITYRATPAGSNAVGVTITFQSDSETTSPVAGPDSLMVPETGFLQSPLISQQLQNPVFGGVAAIINVGAQSDIDAVVPEPTTLSLLGFGLVTLNALLHRRRGAR